MDRLTDIGYLKALLERYGFRFSKSLGQNFIINPGICPKIAVQGGAGPGVGVIEIGPGVGVLTRELAALAEKVVCVEIDARLLPVLRETLSGFGNIRIINDDVLKVDLRRLIREEFAGLEVVVCANLPYYITSPVIMGLLEARLPIRSITVMVQKEAAIRICAPLPGRQAGAVTAAIRYYAAPRMLFSVSRGSFLPAPDVDSSVIRLEVLPEPSIRVQDEKTLFAVIKGAFSTRRKTMLNCVSGSLGLEKGAAAAALEAAGISLTARAEELSLEQFGRLADQIWLMNANST